MTEKEILRAAADLLLSTPADSPRYHFNMATAAGCLLASHDLPRPASVTLADAIDGKMTLAEAVGLR